MFAVNEIQDSNDANGGAKLQLRVRQQVGHWLMSFFDLQ